MKPSEALVQNCAAIRAATLRRNAENPRVFGSVARGEDREHSDVDILVDGLPGMTAFDLGGLQHGLEQLLGRKLDLVTSGGLSPKIRTRVVSEASAL